MIWSDKEIPSTPHKDKSYTGNIISYYKRERQVGKYNEEVRERKELNFQNLFMICLSKILKMSNYFHSKALLQSNTRLILFIKDCAGRIHKIINEIKS